MSKIKVPHCRECPHYRQLNFSWNLVRNNSKMCTKKYHYMNYQEAKTSPKWCPLRAPEQIKGI